MKCETGPGYRAKQNERKKQLYREKKIKECGSEVLYQMGCRPGRPRKYGASPLETYIISTPSTVTPAHSTLVSGDEKE